MERKRVVLDLPEGNRYADVDIYYDSDAKYVKEIYDRWRELCELLSNLNARAVNLPDGLSEISFSIAKSVWRCNSNIPGANSSFDCYDPRKGKGKNRIQVKACSVLPDLTSFGPQSQWDRIYFVDFFRFGKWDGTFDVYEISTIDIDDYKVNARETVKDQKLQGRRPRFSIYDGLIRKGRYLSKETFQITIKGIIKVI